MEETIPADDHSIYSAFDDQSSTLPAVFGGLIGLQNKDVYAIIERTNLPNEEIRVVVDLMRLAEHGIGTPKSLDRDRKSTRLNSSHVAISYAVFCLKKK